MALPSSAGGEISQGWEIAIQIHLASLTPSQRAAFKAPASAEDCMDVIMKSSRRRGSTRFLEALTPILQPLKRFENVIDVVVQTNGGIGSPIWGPLKLAITIANDHAETLEKLAQVLQRIVTSMERYSNYETLFINHLNTQKAIGALYADLLDLCTRVVRFHSRHSIFILAAVFVSFDKEFQQVTANIAHHSTQIDWAANAANIEEAKKARSHEETTRQGNARIAIQQWLSPSSVQDDLSRHDDECMKGSCDWAYNTPVLQKFIASKSPEVLRVGGAPGSGKSTLAAFLVRQLAQFVTGELVYFFCKGTDETKKHPFQVFRTLISQLLARDENLYSWFETLYQSSGQKEAKSLADLRRSFSLALDNTAIPSLYIMVDALDECEDASDLARMLIDAVKSPRGVLVKLILVSRDDPELLDSVGAVNELLILPDDNRSIIWKYVEERVTRIRKIRDKALGKRVHSEVAQAADGLWLYARLMMDEIQRLPSPASIERQLQHIPKGLSQLYQQIFATMEKSFDEESLRLAQQIFLWVDLSTFVQVGRRHLDRRLLDIVIRAANAGEEAFDGVELATSLCSPLVQLFEADDGGIVIDFIHHTAAQFVHECSNGTIPDIPTILRPQKLKELYHAATSVWYFKDSSDCDRALESLRYNPSVFSTGAYFEMAYGLWDAFFLQNLPGALISSDEAEASRLCDMLSTFLSSEDCLKWVEMATIVNYEGNFTKLFSNVEIARRAAEYSLIRPETPSFETFSAQRLEFFSDWCYVIYLTGPGPLSASERPIQIPGGFEKRPRARRMLALGMKWKHLCREKGSSGNLSRNRLPAAAGLDVHNSSEDEDHELDMSCASSA